MLLADGGSGETTKLIGEFNRAVASGNTQSIAVELQALQDFYKRLGQVEQQMESAVNKLRETSMSTGMHEIADTLGEIFSESVPGVDAAVRSGQDNMSGNSNGLGQVLPRLHMTVRKNMWALYETYTAYLQADETGSQELTSAASQQLDDTWNNATSGSPHVAGNGRAIAI